jgi:outer membrane protein assembly factor BamB
MRKQVWMLIIVVSIFLAQFLTSAEVTKADDWTMFRHDQNHSGVTNSESRANSAKFEWVFSTSASVLSSPAIANGVVLVGCKDCYIYCVNASNGKLLWGFRVGHEVNSSPAIYEGKAYVGCYDGWVYCMNISTGVPVWGVNAGGKVQSSPIVIDDRVFIGSGLHNIYCYNASNGTILWTYPTKDPVYSSPAVVDGVLYVACDDFHLYAINATTGEKIWRQYTGSNINSPCVDGTYIYIGAYDGWVSCINASNGLEVWRFQTGDTVGSSAAASYGRVYIGSDDGSVYCLNATSGQKLWQTKTGYWVQSSPAIANGNVFVGSQDYKLYCLDAFTGEEKWSYQTGCIIDSSPSIVNDTLYFGSFDYHLYALKLMGLTTENVDTPAPLLMSTIIFDSILILVWVAVIFAVGRYFYLARRNRQTTQQIYDACLKRSWVSSHINLILGIMILVFSVVFLLNLNAAPLWAADEKTYSQIAYHMEKNGDYFIPWVNGEPAVWVAKPPLIMWLISASYQVLGINNFSTRIWMPLFGVLSLVAIFYLGKKLYNSEVGLLSVLVLGTFTTFYSYSTHAMTDIPLVFFMLASIYYLVVSEEKKLNATVYSMVSGGFFGLALMTKLTEALLIPAIILAFLIFTKRIRFVFTNRFSLYLGTAAAIFLPWVVYMTQISKDFWDSYFVYSSATRLISPLEGHGGNYFYYFNYLLTNETFWAILLPFAIGFCVYNAVNKRSKADILILGWTVIVLGLFTIAQTKLYWYILPALPAFALSISSFLYQLTRKIQGFWKTKMLGKKTKANETKNTLSST